MKRVAKTLFVMLTSAMLIKAFGWWHLVMFAGLCALAWCAVRLGGWLET